MREIILKDILQGYLVEKIHKAEELQCCEEYRAGYREACEEILLYCDFLTVKRRKSFEEYAAERYTRKQSRRKR